MTSSGATRRRFMAGSAAAAAGLALTGAANATVGQGEKGRRGNGRDVAVLGGGIAGLTAAHELAERGFDVTVYERRALGGKARSIDVQGSAAGNRKPLPGEHGFRLVPGFYHNFPDTLRRIPFGDNAGGVWDNLVMPTETMMALTGQVDVAQPVSWKANPDALTLEQLRAALTASNSAMGNVPEDEVAFYVNRLLTFMTSCDERREDTWESTPWWDFTRAEEMSEDYKFFLAVGITRSIVVAKAEVASTRTIGTMIEASVFNALGRGADGPNQRFLTLPTNEALFDPWVALLRKLGVQFKMGWDVQKLAYDGERISKAVVRDDQGVSRDVQADHYVQAMPVQHARRTWGRELRAADPQLGRCDDLVTDWMTGIQYYLTERPGLPHGLVNCLDSPWSLTAITQAELWPTRDFPADYGDGVAVDCLSVDISDWHTPGILYNKPAKQCTREEVAKEVWAQLKAALNDSGKDVLKDSTLHTWQLDPGVQDIGTPHPTNEDELLFHPVGTLHNRPTAKTAVPNFFLAGDYIRVPIELASMEGANSAARMAVNALLDQTGSDAERCKLTPMHREAALEALKEEDLVRFRKGLPNAMDEA
ncbi:hypothetical protein DSC45_24205 [Streptomyces sp. YIM 130001]|uniref:hydroxysqualene dehydroxylase n=1 Tax=Streptomyces sp. YIM 130001 TaxID=2259644 RepID=UPI000E656538|nr:FAD-dependent oxidoreductase [Streptomyces sp. YIM 130001]RII13459.1 hypothetical protein DSC45_24205 [Streptomyces sp. YIM 130001]